QLVRVSEQAFWSAGRCFAAHMTLLAQSAGWRLMGRIKPLIHRAAASSIMHRVKGLPRPQDELSVQTRRAVILLLFRWNSLPRHMYLRHMRNAIHWPWKRWHMLFN